MPEDVARMVETVRAMNPDFQHTVWSEESLNVIGLDVPALIAQHDLPNLACASSFLRLELLKRFGGIYLDTDCECLKPLDPLLDYEAFAAEQDGNRICNAVIGSVANHPWIEWQIEHMGIFDIKDGSAWIYLMTATPRDGVTLIPPHWVYPWMYDTPEKLRVPHPESLLQHFWQGSWCR